MVRIVEALLVGSGMGLVTLACAVLSGASLEASAPWLAALLAALAMGAAWLIELKPGVGKVARLIDERSGLGGALVTAWEVEERGRGGGLGILLGRELRRRLTANRVVRLALPNSMALIACPLVGAAALAVALETRPEPRDPIAALGGVVRGVAAALEEAEEASLEELAAGRVSVQAVDDLGDLARRARRLARDCALGLEDEERRVELTRQVRELLQDLEALEQSEDGSLAARAGLERAGTFADAARLACEAEEGSRGRHAAESALAQSEDSQGEGAPGATPSEAALANAGEDGTISALQGSDGEPATADSPDPPAGGHGPAGGIALGPWWPSRHAGVVERWVEARRAARVRASQDPGDSSE